MLPNNSPAITAVLGGNFDPPHLGHMLIATAALNAGLADSFLFVPSAQARYDRQPLAPATLRLAMLKKSIEAFFPADSRLAVSDCQLEGPLSSGYTIELLENLRSKSEAFLRPVIGADNVAAIDRWHRADELKKEAFILVARPGQVFSAIPAHWDILSDERYLCGASSSAIRALVKERKSISAMVAPQVAALIAEHTLYL